MKTMACHEPSFPSQHCVLRITIKFRLHYQQQMSKSVSPKDAVTLLLFFYYQLEHLCLYRCMLKRVFSSKRDKKKAQQEDSSQLKPLAPSCCCSSCSSSSSATSSSGTYQATAAAARVRLTHAEGTARCSTHPTHIAGLR